MSTQASNYDLARFGMETVPPVITRGAQAGITTKRKAGNP
jgi:hypothetical protein